LQSAFAGIRAAIISGPAFSAFQITVAGFTGRWHMLARVVGLRWVFAGTGTAMVAVDFA